MVESWRAMVSTERRRLLAARQIIGRHEHVSEGDLQVSRPGLGPPPASRAGQQRPS